MLVKGAIGEIRHARVWMMAAIDLVRSQNDNCFSLWRNIQIAWDGSKNINLMCFVNNAMHGLRKRRYFPMYVTLMVDALIQNLLAGDWTKITFVTKQLGFINNMIIVVQTDEWSSHSRNRNKNNKISYVTVKAETRLLLICAYQRYAFALELPTD